MVPDKGVFVSAVGDVDCVKLDSIRQSGANIELDAEQAHRCEFLLVDVFADDRLLLRFENYDVSR